MALPSIICLKSVSNEKYLRYRAGDRTHDVLQFSGEKATDPYANFDVVTAQIGEGHVHLKSRYTNKYLARWTPNENWISASAENPNEDSTSWGCTVFKPTFLDEDPTKVKLLHVQSGHYACLRTMGESLDSCLYAGSEEIGIHHDIFTVIDWTSIFKLPKNVAFKGENGKYLGVRSRGIRYLEFSHDDPKANQVAQEISTKDDGTITIKSLFINQYWSLYNESGLIVAHKHQELEHESMFRVKIIDINVVAILNVKNSKYCKRFTHSDKVDSLHANAESIDEYAIFHVVDLDTLT